MQRTRVAIGIGVAAAIALVLVLRECRGPDGGEPQAPGGESSLPSPAAIVEGTPGAELRVAAGQTLALDSASLEPGRPVRLHLTLGEPSRTDEPRPVRVLGPDGRVLETEARLGDERLDARLELDPAWLSPGRYLVEVRTTEQSHFPLRRYVLEIR